MKKILLLLSVILLFDCTSSDDNKDLQLSQSELLIMNSPWKLTHHEVLEITDLNGTSVTKSQIQGSLNSDTATRIMIFNDDGTGTKVSEYPGNSPLYGNFTWATPDGNKLQIDDNVADSFTVNNNELTFTTSNAEYYQLGTVVKFSVKTFYNKNNI
ncbi:hypothetical protein SAMN05216261_2374 [Algibacter luteus]|uniref:Lipocalin-like domain-containing protein n=2 Tax=Algibacter luteus TaxID=1178825 RepID=A0A1M6FFS9_9FLAO|nr:hypothetical protein SAMN05216261_2374 [Algibacter luteus]